MDGVRTKKIVILLAVIVCVAAIGIYLFAKNNHARNVKFRTVESGFQVSRGGEWQDFLIKGVNMGVGKPGSFPGEMQITKDEYQRWFRQIAEMNANTVRVYTIQPPAFYEALFEYNLFTDKPLYIFHGVWLNEDAILEYYDAYVPAITDDFESEIEKLINVLHGNAVLPSRPGHASGTYRWDVSPYVAGYILGIELDATFVINTNDVNADIKNFDGTYLYTENASPHECWLAQMGDFTISYEQDRYGAQKPVSWVNWLTTDPLEHPAEPNPEMEDAVSVDTEHIRAKEPFSAGLFASYHIYPYYPEFMMYQPEYANYVDDQGKTNPYKAYLLELRAHHTVPLLVAEFGIPASRGCTHVNVVTGYNQGFMTEQQQGEYVADMFESIVEADCAGGLVFSWQDEWFKRSWNTMDYDIPDRRPFWSNVQVSEQYYGLLSFDPGKERSVCYVDGDISEWTDQTPVGEAENLALYAMSDEKFVYFMIRDESGNVAEKKYVIGVDGTGGMGSREYTELGISFSGAADHIVLIDGLDNSRVLVDAYHDIWYRIYSRFAGRVKILDQNVRYEQKNSGIFNPINLILNRALLLPLTEQLILPKSYETGKLLHGNANPGAEDYNSLADFYINPEHNSIEIRIPWQLFNVADPAHKMIVGDMYQYEDFDINVIDIDGFSLEMFTITDGTAQSQCQGYYYWEAWEEPVYHERLKKSYYILQEKFSRY